MKIGMIAAMVIGMVVLNGCASDYHAFNKVKETYKDRKVNSIIVIDSGKVTILHYNTVGDFTDSTTYVVPSKCQ